MRRISQSPWRKLLWPGQDPASTSPDSQDTSLRPTRASVTDVVIDVAPVPDPPTQQVSNMHINDEPTIRPVSRPGDAYPSPQASPALPASSSQVTGEEPAANDYEAFKETIFGALPDEPLEIADDKHFTWEIQQYKSLGIKEHSPVFQCGGQPWRILLFPFGNNADNCSIYLEHGYGTEEFPEMPDNWHCCALFGLVMWSPTNPKIVHHHSAQHRFTKEEGDWGFTRFLDMRKLFMPWEDSEHSIVAPENNGTVNITAYVRVIKDETGVLWHPLTNYDSKTETGLVGLKNQGATCYLNSLLQSLYFTNAFRMAVFQIPTGNDETLDNSAYTLQRLFFQLQTSVMAVDTRELTRSFGWETRQVFEQQDVQELSRKLMELLEDKMKGTQQQTLLPSMFSGKLKTYVSCINVDFESSRIEDFWDVQLNVPGLANLEESFKDYISVERLEGDNQYFAGEKYQLQDANKGVIFVSLPDVLHLQLKRFDYDPMLNTTTKLNDRWEYPAEFDAEPFLAPEADRSESWVYQLHSVLVHQGELNAGHYYAFIRPAKDGWFYRFDDDKVTKARMAEVLEENYGGEIRLARGTPMLNSRGQPAMRQNSAYMLVYIRKSRFDKVLPPIADEDIPSHLRDRFEQELREKERIQREKEEQPFYMIIRVASVQSFTHYEGFDLGDFNSDDQDDPAIPRRYRILKASRISEFLKQVASERNCDPKLLRLWSMVNRQNRTTRPDLPIYEINSTFDETFKRPLTIDGLATLRLWLEEADSVNEKGEPDWVWPPYSGPSANGGTSAGENRPVPMFLFLKYFNVEAQTLTGVGTIYMSPDKKVEDIIPAIRQKMGWDKASSDEKISLFEEIKPTMIELMKPKQTLKAAELQDGDIICFQRTVEKKSTLARLGIHDASTTPAVKPSSDHYDDARDFYEYMHYKRKITLMPHPDHHPDSDAKPQLELWLNLKLPYDDFASKVGEKLEVEGTHLRFFTVNSTNGRPKSPVKRSLSANSTLQGVLNPGASYPQLNSTQRNNALFYQVLDMTLSEVESRKPVTVTWVTEGITKEETFDLLISKTGTVDDILQQLEKKANLASEAEAGELRVYEISNHKIHREVSRNVAVVTLNEYVRLVVERIPQEELKNSEKSLLLPAYQYQTDPTKAHGVPFLFLVLEDEKFSDTLPRLVKRTGFKGKSFEKIKFTVVRRGSHSPVHQLREDDILWNLVKDEDNVSLGLDHPDRNPKNRSGNNDLTLK